VADEHIQATPVGEVLDAQPSSRVHLGHGAGPWGQFAIYRAEYRNRNRNRQPARFMDLDFKPAAPA
jgi:hypothetical protein